MKRILAKQQVRFLLAGCFNTGLDFFILNVLILGFRLPELAANTISVSVGICVSYVLNHFFVFRYPEPIRLWTFAKFFVVTGFSSLILQNLVIFGFESFFNTGFGNSLLVFAGPSGRAFVALNVAKVVAVLLGLIWNFTMYRFVVFRRTRTRDEPTSSEGSVGADSRLGRSSDPDPDPVP